MSAGVERLSGNPACHVVQFYGADDELIDSVVRYLADGIDDGDVVVVVATGAHRLAFDASLVARGVNVAAARADGSYVVLDAEETMREFLVADRPEAAGFESAVGMLIRQAHRTGRPVRVYGEMVALLWEAGHVNAAIALEALWNALASQVDFSLFCAYAAQAVSGHDHRDAFTEVCRLHSAVVGHPARADADGHQREDNCQDVWVTII